MRKCLWEFRICFASELNIHDNTDSYDEVFENKIEKIFRIYKFEYVN